MLDNQTSDMAVRKQLEWRLSTFIIVIKLRPLANKPPPPTTKGGALMPCKPAVNFFTWLTPFVAEDIGAVNIDKHFTNCP